MTVAPEIIITQYLVIYRRNGAHSSQIPRVFPFPVDAKKPLPVYVPKTNP